MKKYFNLFGLFGATLATALLLSTAVPTKVNGASLVEGPKVNWRVALWGKRRAVTESLEFLSEQLAKRTGGNFQFKLYYGAQLSKPKENLDGISLGAFEASLVLPAYHPGKVPELNVLDLGFLPLANLDVMFEVHSTIFAHPIIQKAMRKWNAHIFMPSMLPQYEIMGRGKPPRTMADFDGMRIRMLGGMRKAMQQLGAVPASVISTETYNALSRGTVDAISAPMSYMFHQYRLEDVSEWYTTNLKLGTISGPIVFNQAAYGKLPQQYKDLLEELRMPAAQAVVAAYKKFDKVNIPRFQRMLIPITYNAAQVGRASQKRWKAAVENVGQRQSGQVRRASAT